MKNITHTLSEQVATLLNSFEGKELERELNQLIRAHAETCMKNTFSAGFIVGAKAARDSNLEITALLSRNVSGKYQLTKQLLEL